MAERQGISVRCHGAREWGHAVGCADADADGATRGRPADEAAQAIKAQTSGPHAPKKGEAEIEEERSKVTAG